MSLSNTYKLVGAFAFSLVVATIAKLEGTLDPSFYFWFSFAQAYFWLNFYRAIDEVASWWRIQPPFQGFQYWFNISVRRKGKC